MGSNLPESLAIAGIAAVKNSQEAWEAKQMPFVHRRGCFGVLTGDDFVPPRVDGKISKFKDEEEDVTITLEDAKKLSTRRTMMRMLT